MTLWFDPNGGTEKTFGIRFPLGNPETAAAMGRNEYKSETEARLREFCDLQTECEVLNNGEKEVRRLNLTDAGLQGIEVKIGFQTANFSMN